MGPKRDIVGELAKAVRAKGLRFGVSSHRAFNWAYFGRRADFDTVDPKNFGLYGRDIDYLYTATASSTTRRTTGRRTTRPSKTIGWLAPANWSTNINPTWSGSTSGSRPAGWSPTTRIRTPNIYSCLRPTTTTAWPQQDRGAIINYKFNAFPEQAAVLDLERSKMDQIREPFWQTDTAVSTNSWGYMRNQVYKPVNRLIDDLVDIVSKNGCLLLNIGPKPDGTIPEHEQEMLREIGRWLDVNGEAIYATTTVEAYGEGPDGHGNRASFREQEQSFHGRRHPLHNQR